MTAVTYSEEFTSATTGDTGRIQGRQHTHQAIVTGTGAVSATVIHEGTNDQTGEAGWTTMVTLEMAGTTSASDVAPALLHTWALVRARCTAISGTGAVVRTTISGE